MTNTYETFVGRLGANPELRYTKNQKAVCHLSIAISQGDNKKPIWKKVVVWGDQGANAKLRLSKGKQVFVQGRIERKEYRTIKGDIKSYEEINANLIGFIMIYDDFEAFRRTNILTH